MQELISATNNKNKLREFREILGDKFIISSLADEGITVEIEEDADTFYGNALKKAKTIAELTGKPALADDSGLIVDALGGAPGVYSARYGGEDGKRRKIAALGTGMRHIIGIKLDVTVVIAVKLVCVNVILCIVGEGEIHPCLYGYSPAVK